MATASDFLLAANDEHGLNPPTAGKRTPQMPYIDRPIYENEFNKPAKNYFLSGALRLGFNVFDVHPETTDTPVSTRVRRTNQVRPNAVLSFAYNALGNGSTFNSANGYLVYFSPQNVRYAASRSIAINVDNALTEFVTTKNLGIGTLFDVGMLSSVTCPAVLLECGFMTNFSNAKLMIDPDYQKATGEGALKGICDYFGVPYSKETAPTGLPTLRIGNGGRFVKYLQYLLIEQNYDLTPDGVFGSGTQKAVASYQSLNGLAADGVVGKNTWASLVTTANPLPTLRVGSKGKYVLYLQRKLYSFLYNVGTIDGKFGENTRRAVTEFQTENGLTPDGIVGTKTWEKIKSSSGRSAISREP